MNPPLRRLAFACLLLFAALLINANYVQVVDARSLRHKPQNIRLLISEYDRQRGAIVVDGQAIATSRPTHDRLKYLRVYPGGAEYAAVTGYFSLVYGSVGIERAEDSVLGGTDDRFFVRRLSDLLTGRTPRGGAVLLTLSAKAQNAAWHALAGREGAVVALDPSTGAILALVSSPSYDPSSLSSHDTAAIRRAWTALIRNPARPLVNRAIGDRFPPGSLFKVVTTTAALKNGYTPQTQIPAPPQLPLPLSRNVLKNFAGEQCAGNPTTLADALRISCNTAYAGLGLKLGANRLRDAAHAFDIGDSHLSIPLPVAQSVFPDQIDAPQTALSAIGQFDVALTPLQAAMIAAGVANRGVVMKPYLVKELDGPDLQPVETASPQSLGRALSDTQAAALTSMMELVVQSGTGTAAQLPGTPVAGKTGTAQHGNGQPPDVWFICFAPADHPKVAVAVFLPNGGGRGANATGGTVAAPVARAVLQAVLSP